MLPNATWVHAPKRGTLIIRRPLRPIDALGATGERQADFVADGRTLPLDGGVRGWISTCAIQ